MKKILLLVLMLAPVLARAQTVSSLPPAGALSGTEITNIVQGGVSKRATLQAIANLAAGSTVYSEGYAIRIVGGVIRVDTILIASKTWVASFVNNAIAAYVPSPLWSNVLSKPSSFPPSAHTHTPIEIQWGAATAGQVWKYNGTNWAPGTDNSGGGATDTTHLSDRINLKINALDSNKDKGYVSWLMRVFDSTANAIALAGKAPLSLFGALTSNTIPRIDGLGRISSTSGMYVNAGLFGIRVPSPQTGLELSGIAGGVLSSAQAKVLIKGDTTSTFEVTVDNDTGRFIQYGLSAPSYLANRTVLAAKGTSKGVTIQTSSTSSRGTFSIRTGQQDADEKFKIDSFAIHLKTSILLNGSTGTNGQVFTSAGSGSIPNWTTLALNSLADVNIVSPFNGAVLKYNGTTNKWEVGSDNVGGGSGGGDMFKATYDANNDGAADNAELLGGQSSAYHRGRSNHTGFQLASTISDFSTAARLLFSATGTGLTYNNATGVFNWTNPGYLTSYTETDPIWGSVAGNYRTKTQNDLLYQAILTTGTTAQYIRGDLSLATFPAFGTAAARNVAASGDAAAAEVVKGDDSRLTNSRAPTTHTHTEAEVTGLVNDLAAKADKRISINTQTASYSLVLADESYLVRMNVATANNLTVPLNSAQAFPIGAQVTVVNLGAGQTTFLPTSGVTINSAGGALKLRVQYSAATLIKTATDTWLLVGDIAL